MPARIAEFFAENLRFDTSGAELIDKSGYSSSRWRLFEREERIEGVREARLHVDYQSTVGHSDLLILQYVGKIGDNAEEQVLSEIQLSTGVHFGGEYGEARDSRAYEIPHRFTLPEMRGKKLASRLLAEAEGFVHDVANAQKREATLSMATGQEDVISWIEKKGYKPTLMSDMKLKEYRKHPERFTIDAGTTQLGETQEGFIFRNGTKGRMWSDALRVEFKKKLAPKKA